MSDLSYPVVIDRLPDEDGGGYVAYAIDLFGCMSDGATYEEAAANIQLAIQEWIDEMKRLGREVPAPNSAVQTAKTQREELVEVAQRLLEIVSEKDKELKRLSKLFEEKTRAVETLDAEVRKLHDLVDLSAKGDDCVPLDWVQREKVIAAFSYARRATKNNDIRH